MKRLKDEELQVKIQRRLIQDPTINISTIQILAHDGEVSLHGFVDSCEDRSWVEDLVKDIPEVESVVNRLGLGPVEQNHSL